MKPEAKRVLAELQKPGARKIERKAASWLGALMDRRAAKRGKLVLWWRRTFGRITPGNP